MNFMIRRDGRWLDCDQLLLFDYRDGIVLDIGGNIGCCALLMLAAGARVIAFEPVMFNLYYFTRSVLANPQEWNKRLTLYPFGLGAEEKKETIFTEVGNAGNFVLESPVHAKGPSFDVFVKRLDDVLWPDASKPAPRISVLKIDAQGYELKILAGAKRLLAARAIRCVKAEIATDWLKGQGVTPSDYCTALKSAGFVLKTTLNTIGTAKNSQVVTDELCRKWDDEPVVFDIFGCLEPEK
jgi:FkbM family methyltransferase